MIGELAEYVPVLCKMYEIDRELVTLVNVDALNRVVPTLPEKLSAKVQRPLRENGRSGCAGGQRCGSGRGLH
jgi:NADH dehydrogenase